tara:strand:+ start:223 stop:660 length:438 start_codon:yes stop_codon:yes gene_type:complete
MSEEEFDTEPEPVIEEKPSLTKTILSAISEEEVEPVVETTTEETPDFADVMKPSRGPPGGGRLVRDGAPTKPVSGPPTKGPPMLEDEMPSEEDEVESKLPTLAPILKPIRKPISIEPKETGPTVLKPVGRAVLKPISKVAVDEEE